jgi:hypothetical protein
MAFLDLIEETENHFKEGATSVRAYAAENTYIITRAKDSDHYWVAIEDQNFRKEKAESLDPFFHDVFGIEANY